MRYFGFDNYPGVQSKVDGLGSNWTAKKGLHWTIRESGRSLGLILAHHRFSTHAITHESLRGQKVSLGIF